MTQREKALVKLLIEWIKRTRWLGIVDMVGDPILITIRELEALMK